MILNNPDCLPCLNRWAVHSAEGADTASGMEKLRIAVLQILESVQHNLSGLVHQFQEVVLLDLLDNLFKTSKIL